MEQLNGNMTHQAFDRNCYETPDWLFNYLNKEFSFSMDLCAVKETAKCDKFITPSEDSLSIDWHKLPNGYLWLNPPYSPLKPWLKKAQKEAMLGAKIVALVPPILCTSYLYDFLPSEIRLIVGRISFLANKVEKKGNRDDSCIMIWHGHSVTKPNIFWIKRDEMK